MTSSPIDDTTDTIDFIITVDEGDLEELAERQTTEGARHAAWLEITRLIRKRERENEMMEEARDAAEKESRE